MATPVDFSQRLNRLAVQVGEGGDRAVRTAFLAIDRNVVMATPVDTGRARSNWLPNLDAAREENIDAFAPGEKGSTGAANADRAMQAAQDVAKRYDGDRNRELHLTNNLPYIGVLNYQGTSPQAAALFVERAIAAAVSALRGVRLLP